MQGAGVLPCKGRLVAYGLRVILGEVRMPGAGKLPLDLGLVWGENMVTMCLESDICVAMIDSRWLLLKLDGFSTVPKYQI